MTKPDPDEKLRNFDLWSGSNDPDLLDESSLGYLIIGSLLILSAGLLLWAVVKLFEGFTLAVIGY
jgi:hypothetical protein